jgi:hypothetical protein
MALPVARRDLSQIGSGALPVPVAERRAGATPRAAGNAFEALARCCGP